MNTIIHSLSGSCCFSHRGDLSFVTSMCPAAVPLHSHGWPCSKADDIRKSLKEFLTLSTILEERRTFNQ